MNAASAITSSDRRSLHRQRDARLSESGWQTRVYAGHSVNERALAGKLRLIRKGDVAYYLFAENESNTFQLVEKQTEGTGDVRFSGIRLLAVAGGKGNKTEVLWKDLTIRAEEILTKPAVRAAN